MGVGSWEFGVGSLEMGDGRWEFGVWSGQWSVVSRSGQSQSQGKGKREKSSVGSGQLSVICSLLSVLSLLPRIEGLKGF